MLSLLSVMAAVMLIPSVGGAGACWPRQTMAWIVAAMPTILHEFLLCIVPWWLFLLVLVGHQK